MEVIEDNPLFDLVSAIRSTERTGGAKGEKRSFRQGRFSGNTYLSYRFQG